MHRHISVTVVCVYIECVCLVAIRTVYGYFIYRIGRLTLHAKLILEIIRLQSSTW